MSRGTEKKEGESHDGSGPLSGESVDPLIRDQACFPGEGTEGETSKELNGAQKGVRVIQTIDGGRTARSGHNGKSGTIAIGGTSSGDHHNSLDPKAVLGSDQANTLMHFMNGSVSNSALQGPNTTGGITESKNQSGRLSEQPAAHGSSSSNGHSSALVSSSNAPYFAHTLPSTTPTLLPITPNMHNNTAYGRSEQLCSQPPPPHPNHHATSIPPVPCAFSDQKAHGTNGSCPHQATTRKGRNRCSNFPSAIPTEQLFFGVRRGHQPGVYYTLEECLYQTTGFPSPLSCQFQTFGEAQRFVFGDDPRASSYSHDPYEQVPVRDFSQDAPNWSHPYLTPPRLPSGRVESAPGATPLVDIGLERWGMSPGHDNLFEGLKGKKQIITDVRPLSLFLPIH